MTAPDRGVSNGLNSLPVDDTVAETGPGIPDDAVMAGELTPGDLNRGADAAVKALERSGWAPSSAAEGESETQAHPS